MRTVVFYATREGPRRCVRRSDETGWRPARVLPVAGALAYSRYNFLIRFVMKRIARKAGAPTDTSRDYEFTNWPALDTFIREGALAAGGTEAGSPITRSA